MKDPISGNVPTVEEYQAAIGTAWENSKSKPELIFEAHFQAPRHALTHKQLGESVGHRSSRSIYWRFAARVLKALNREKGREHWIDILVIKDDAEGMINGEYRLVLRPEVVQAIRNLGLLP